MDEVRPDLAIRPNKSQQKRDLAARAELIERMTGLSDKELRKLDVADEDIALVAELRAMKPSGARNRQLKYCVKQLDGVDLSTVETYLYNRQSQQLEMNQAFHRLENWRDRLVREGDEAIGGAMDEWPHLDRQRLRQLVRDAQREAEGGKPPGAARKLFRYLRELAESQAG